MVEEAFLEFTDEQIRNYVYTFDMPNTCDK